MTSKLGMADLHRLLLGFDRFMDTNVAGEYPRYNIVKVGDKGYRIELAVPSWHKEDIEITLHQGALTVEGITKPAEKEGESYLYKGLSGKCFKRSFGVSEHIKLDRAYMERGLLCIDLHEELPNELQPVKVTIS